MKLVYLGIGLVVVVAVFGSQTTFAQTLPPAPVKVIGCLQGDGSEQTPWYLAGAALPPPAPAAPAGGGGRGGGGRGGAGAAAPGGGAAAGGGGQAAGAGQGAAPGGAPGGAAPAGGGRGGGGRGGRGAGAGAPAVPPAPVPLVDLRLAGGMNMAPWRGMKVEVEGMLGPKPASGMQEIRITAARSVQGVCTPK